MNNDRDLMQEALDALTYVGDKAIYSDTIDALRARLSQPEPTNRFNPDWDAIPVMVEEQQRMAKRIEELESQLGEAMWDYGEWRRKAEISSALCTRQGIRLMEYESQEKQEPVAVWELQEGGWDTIADPDWMETLPIGTKLYTAPPQREWVGLTKEELAEIAEFHFHGALSGREFYDDVEAKLKEKNNG